MYIFPLPELKTRNPIELLWIINGIPDNEWWWQPARNPNERCKTMWYKLFKGDPTYEMYVEQFALDRSAFDDGDIEIHYYKLLPNSELHNHKDRSRNTILFVNLDNLNDTRLYFYPNGERGIAPIMTMELPPIPYVLDGLEHHGVKNSSNKPRIALTLSFHKPYNFDVLEEIYKDRSLLKCQLDEDYRFVGGRKFWREGPMYPDGYAGKERGLLKNAYGENDE